MTFRATLAALAIALGLAHGTGRASAPPSVTIDGQLLTLDRPPILLAGIVLVPLRPIFEHLGARVHIAGAAIDATSPTHTIALEVGRSVATVDGVQQPLSTPPVLVAGTVYVPLRFVATALGAKIHYDRAGRMVVIERARDAAASPVLPAITTPPSPPTESPTPIASAAPATPQPTPTPLPSGSIVLRLVREEPARGTSVARVRPEVSASFDEPVNPASVRVVLDGRDVTADAKITDRSFIFEPQNDVPIGAHEVVVVGKTPLREPFTDRWSFESAAPKGKNYLTGIEPPSGITVTSPVIVGGITLPHARVGVVATSSETASHFSELSGGSFSDNTTANDRGQFEIRIDLADTGSGFLDVRIDSVAPGGGVAVKTLRLRL